MHEIHMYFCQTHIGGFSSQAVSRFCEPLNMVESYNPGAKLWTVEQPMGLARGILILTNIILKTLDKI